MKNYLIFVIFIIFSCFVVSNAYNPMFNGCYTLTNEPGICQYLDQCTSLLHLLAIGDQLTRNQWPYLSYFQCGYYNNEPLVCCSDSLIQTGSSNVLPEPGECGIDVSNKIVGGTNTDVDEFPWMALLEYKKPQNIRGFDCGGVFISKRYVVTAAHCVKGKRIPATWSLSSVRLGEYDLSTDVDCVTTETGDDCNESPIDVPISEIIPHEDYNSLSKHQNNDVALLRLQYDVPFTDFIKPICLPRQQQLRSLNYDGFKLDVVGWGKTETGRRSNIKLKVRLNGFNIQQCSNVYNRFGFILQSSQLCAGGEANADSCNGDSGGPIMTVDHSGKIPYWYLVGVVDHLAHHSVDKKDCPLYIQTSVHMLIGLNQSYTLDTLYGSWFC